MGGGGGMKAGMGGEKHIGSCGGGGCGCCCSWGMLSLMTSAAGSDVDGDGITTMKRKVGTLISNTYPQGNYKMQDGGDQVYGGYNYGM